MKPGGWLIAGIAAFGLLIAPGAAAKTFEVTRAADTIPNGCNQGGCTLREAIIAANNRDSADVVVLRSGRTYTLQLVGVGEDLSATGDLDVLGELAIRSSARRRATIDANGIERALHAFARLGVGRIVVNGGIWAQDAGVSLTRSVVTGAAAATGVLQTGGGSVNATRSSVRANDLDGILEQDGGGVRASRTTVSDNGGQGIQESNDGNLVLVRSTVARNGQTGVFVNPPGSARISGSTIERNESTLGGGGINLIGTVGATITGSTIAGNTSTSGGGGISMNGAELRITNSTITGNRADGDGGGIFAFGASDVRLNAVTVARNVADLGGSGDAGGGLRQSNTTTFAAENSLIALNRTAMAGLGPDCFQVLPFDSGGHNLLTDDSGCTGFDAPSDRVRANPRIGGLQRNGGSTKTIALKKRSPAIGKAGNDAPNRDQRGRKRDRRPDIGAFER